MDLSPASPAQPPVATRAVEPAHARPVGASASAASRASGPGASDTVQISGKSMLLGRLFHATEASQDTSVYAPGSRPTGSQRIYNYLNESDRSMLAGVYESAARDGGDLREVDALAFDLAVYRSSPASSYVDSVGKTFYENGAPVVFSFSPADEEVAQRILTSNAMKDTAVPQAFLRRILDPGLSPGQRASNLSFIEKVVYASSPSGSDGSTDASAVLSPRPIERLAHLIATGTLAPPHTSAGDGRPPGGPDAGSPALQRSIARLSAGLEENMRGVLALLYTGKDTYPPNLPLPLEGFDALLSAVATQMKTPRAHDLAV